VHPGTPPILVSRAGSEGRNQRENPKNDISIAVEQGATGTLREERKKSKPGRIFEDLNRKDAPVRRGELGTVSSVDASVRTFTAFFEM